MKKEHTVDLHCSFCGKHQHEVRKLIAGPTVYICDECVKLCNEIIAGEAKRAEPAPEQPAPPKGEGIAKTDNLLCCSFCGKSQREVKNLIAGPTVYICDECIGLCNDIIAEEIELETQAASVRSVLPAGARTFLGAILDRGSGRIETLSEHSSARRSRFGLRERLLMFLYRLFIANRRHLTARAIALLHWLYGRNRRRIEVLASLDSLVFEWRTLRSMLLPDEQPASCPARTELPEWVRPIADRLSTAVEVLEAIDVRPRRVELAASGGSVDLARVSLRHARDLLVAGPPKAPVD
jgi:hypothetical protein